MGDGRAHVSSLFTWRIARLYPSLESRLFADPWTESLRGRNVLVIHPFEESIQRQYEKHTRLFRDERVLPEFGRIDTVKAVQSVAGNSTEYVTWFDALESMRAQIADKDFDVALIGAGAYGLPLAAFVKDLGRKAVHLGGVTQILFGIIGSRWERVIPRVYRLSVRFVNSDWTRPLPEETPIASKLWMAEHIGEPHGTDQSSPRRVLSETIS